MLGMLQGPEWTLAEDEDEEEEDFSALGSPVCFHISRKTSIFFYGQSYDFYNHRIIRIIEWFAPCFLFQQTCAQVPSYNLILLSLFFFILHVFFIFN